MQASISDPVASAQENAQQRAKSVTSELGRNEFMQLLVAKLENQDPLQPANDTEFIAELATFSSLEQLIDVNSNLELLSDTQDQLISAQTLDLIGKEALVESGNQLRVKDGEPDTIVYAIPRQAGEATLSLINSEGDVVRTFELDRTPHGRVTLDWTNDGTDGEPLPDGDYELRINVTDTEGEPMSIALFRSLPIDGVSFLDGLISLVSGDREIPFEAILEIREGRS